MTVTAALFVDSVRQSDDGTVDLVGLVEGFHFPSLPVTVEDLLLFLRLALDPDDRGKPVRLSFHLLGPDGQQKSPESVLSVKIPSEGELPAPDATLLPKLSLTFHRPGVHRLELRVGGDAIHSFPFLVYPK